MAAITAFRKIQIGREATAGTKVAATQKLYGELTAEVEKILHMPNDERGSLARYHRTTVVGENINVALKGDLTFFIAPYLFENAIKTVADPADGGEGDYTRTYAPGLTAANTPKTFTLEYGNDTQEHEIEYVVTRSLEISGEADGPLQFSADMFGRNRAGSSFSSLSDIAVETAVFNKTKLCIEAAGGVPGTTEKTLILHGFTWKLKTGFVPSKRGGDALFFNALNQEKIELAVDLILTDSSDAETLRSSYEAGTAHVFQLETTGSLIGGAVYNKLTLDFAGVITKFGTLEEREGGDVVGVTVEAQYDATYTKLFENTVINEDALL